MNHRLGGHRDNGQRACEAIRAHRRLSERPTDRQALEPKPRAARFARHAQRQDGVVFDVLGQELIVDHRVMAIR